GGRPPKLRGPVPRPPEGKHRGMKTTRLIAGTTAAGLLGLVPLAVSAPAHAAETFQPQAALTVSLPYELQGSDRIPVGASVDVEIDVKYVGSSGAALTPYKGAAS